MQKCLCALCVLTLCFAVLFSLPAHAEGISVDGYIQPAEWEGALFTTLLTSEEESGCRISYADVRAMVDAPSRCICFALQVIDEAFSGAAGHSRIHIQLGNAELSVSPDGEARLSGGGYTARAAGFYQAGGYNRDYVLEVEITRASPFPGGRLPVSIWFTDGAGKKSRACELTLDTGAPITTSTATPEESSTKAPLVTEPSQTAVQTQPVASSEQRPGASEAHTTHHASGGGEVTAAPQPEEHVSSTHSQGSVLYESEALGGETPGGAQQPQAYDSAVQGQPGRGASLEGDALGEPMETVTIPATGESGAGQWSATRIAACVAAGICILAAALLLVFQTRRKEKTDTPSAP